MTWIIRRGKYEYMFAGMYGAVGFEWTDDQALAHRFDDRNEAARIVGNMSADDDVRIVKLVTPRDPKGVK